MSFKDSKAQILANSASDDSDISTMEADLATTAVVDDGYVLCTDGRYVIYDEYYDNSYSTVDKLKNVTVDSSQINIVQETNSQYIPFRIPRYWDGIDLMKMLIQIRYENVSTKKGQVSTAVNVASKLTDKPIEYLIGSLTVPITISTLDDGIYKIKGQFIIGGNSTTVHSSADEVFFLVSHDEDTHGTSITQFKGNSILLYFIQQDGDYVTDKYVTEKWVNDQNFMSADSAKQFIQEQLELTVSDLVDKKIDEALDKKIGGLESADIANIFN